MAKQKSCMNKLRGQANDASKDSAKEIESELANLDK